MKQPAPLYTVIASAFTLEEMQQMCVALGVDFEGLPGYGKQLKALGLQEYLSNRGRIDELLNQIHKERPILDLRPYLYLVINDRYYNEDAIIDLYASFGLEVRNFREAEKFAWGSEPWRQQKALLLQEYMKEKGRIPELLSAIQKRDPDIELSFYEPISGLKSASVAPMSDESARPKPPDTTPDTGAPLTGLPETGTPEVEMEPAKYFGNFDLHIGKGRDGQYALSVIYSPVGETEQEVLSAFPTSATEGPITFLRNLIGRESDAEQLGDILQDFLFPGPIKELFMRSREMVPGLRVRLRISGRSPELSLVPWEYCRDDRSYLALNRKTPLLRYLPTDRPPIPITVPEQVRVLLVMASPTGFDPVNVEAEEAWVRQALQPLIASEQVALEVEPHTSRRELYRYVNKFDPHILHFLGHGVVKKDGEGALIMEGKGGRAELADGQQMLVLLQNSKVRLVLLSACQTASHGEYEAFMGVAPGLVRAGIPAVVAMQFEVPQHTAVTFVHDLYEDLVAGQPLDVAMTSARIGAYLDDPVFWAIPVLYMRSPNGVIWE